MRLVGYFRQIVLPAHLQQRALNDHVRPTVQEHDESGEHYPPYQERDLKHALVEPPQDPEEGSIHANHDHLQQQDDLFLPGLHDVLVLLVVLDREQAGLGAVLQGQRGYVGVNQALRVQPVHLLHEDVRDGVAQVLDDLHVHAVPLLDTLRLQHEEVEELDGCEESGEEDLLGDESEGGHCLVESTGVALVWELTGVRPWELRLLPVHNK